jgi:hypothetical protein
MQRLFLAHVTTHKEDVGLSRPRVHTARFLLNTRGSPQKIVPRVCVCIYNQTLTSSSKFKTNGAACLDLPSVARLTFHRPLIGAVPPTTTMNCLGFLPRPLSCHVEPNGPLLSNAVHRGKTLPAAHSYQFLPGVTRSFQSLLFIARS